MTSKISKIGTVTNFYIIDRNNHGNNFPVMYNLVLKEMCLVFLTYMVSRVIGFSLCSLCNVLRDICRCHFSLHQTGLPLVQST